MRRARALPFVALVLAGCGASSPSAATPTALAPTVAEESEPSPLSAADVALLDEWAVRAAGACERARASENGFRGGSLEPEPPPCGIDHDAHWRRERVFALGDGGAGVGECRDCSYVAATRSGICELPNGRLRWQLDEAGRVARVERDEDRDGTADFTSSLSYDESGATRAEWQFGSGDDAELFVMTESVRGDVRLVEVDRHGDGSVEDWSRTVLDAVGFETEITVGGPSIENGPGLENVIRSCTSPTPTTRECRSSEGVERIELDARGRPVSGLLDVDDDGSTDRRWTRLWQGDELRVEERWRLEHDDAWEDDDWEEDEPAANDEDGSSAAAAAPTFVLSHRTVSDGRREVTVEGASVDDVALTTIECD